VVDRQPDRTTIASMARIDDVWPVHNVPAGSSRAENDDARQGMTGAGTRQTGGTAIGAFGSGAGVEKVPMSGPFGGEHGELEFRGPFALEELVLHQSGLQAPSEALDDVGRGVVLDHSSWS
jgi:hypothetical protein